MLFRYPSCLLLCLVIACAACVEGEEMLYRCVSVWDGDDVLVETTDGLVAQIRLMGIDTPEIGQNGWGKKAREFSEDFCRNKKVRLEFDKRRQDNRGRNLCYVWVDERMLNLELVRAGLAIPYYDLRNVSYKKDILDARDQARNAKKGFWKQGGLRETPREYRDRKFRD